MCDIPLNLLDISTGVLLQVMRVVYLRRTYIFPTETNRAIYTFRNHLTLPNPAGTGDTGDEARASASCSPARPLLCVCL
jgi:hypothetical protein